MSENIAASLASHPAAAQRISPSKQIVDLARIQRQIDDLKQDMNETIVERGCWTQAKDCRTQITRAKGSVRS